MTGVLLDTDVMIDHIRGVRRVETHPSTKGLFSVVTRTELFAGHEREEAAVEALLKRFTEIDLNPDIARRAGRIRRTTGLDVPDALIAATALEHQLPLMTRNLRHFERVAGLTMHDPPDRPKPPAQGGAPTDAGGSQPGTPD